VYRRPQSPIFFLFLGGAAPRERRRKDKPPLGSAAQKQKEFSAGCLRVYTQVTPLGLGKVRSAFASRRLATTAKGGKLRVRCKHFRSLTNSIEAQMGADYPTPPRIQKTP
jgi:hypothetical protein